MTAQGNPDTRPTARRRWLTVLPLVIFGGLAALFFLRLGSVDPSKIPSVLVVRRPQPRFPRSTA